MSGASAVETIRRVRTRADVFSEAELSDEAKHALHVRSWWVRVKAVVRIVHLQLPVTCRFAKTQSFGVHPCNHRIVVDIRVLYERIDCLVQLPPGTGVGSVVEVEQRLPNGTSHARYVGVDATAIDCPELCRNAFAAPAS